MSDWMKQNQVSEIQTAIQTQTIQTALEKNSSVLTDTAFQSYLTNAPIPRFTSGLVNATITTGLTTIATYAAPSLVDQYSLLTPSTGIFRASIDGWWLLNFVYQFTGGATAGGYVNPIFTYVPSGAPLASSLTVAPGLATTAYQNTMTLLYPFSAGETVRIDIGNTTGATLSAMNARLSGVWTSPLKNYSGGN